MLSIKGWASGCDAVWTMVTCQVWCNGCELSVFFQSFTSLFSDFLQFCFPFFRSHRFNYICVYNWAVYAVCSVVASTMCGVCVMQCVPCQVSCSVYCSILLLKCYTCWLVMRNKKYLNDNIAKILFITILLLEKIDCAVKHINPGHFLHSVASGCAFHIYYVYLSYWNYQWYSIITVSSSH